MNKNAGLISMGGYLPGKDVPENKMDRFINFLETTDLHPDYIQMIKETKRMPGKSESNEEGWISQPWYEEWFNRLPEKKKEDPFKGTEFRCRVPMDPVSEKINAPAPNAFIRCRNNCRVNGYC